jgi:hypothetical protein
VYHSLAESTLWQFRQPFWEVTEVAEQSLLRLLALRNSIQSADLLLAMGSDSSQASAEREVLGVLAVELEEAAMEIFALAAEILLRQTSSVD